MLWLFGAIALPLGFGYGTDLGHKFGIGAKLLWIHGLPSVPSNACFRKIPLWHLLRNRMTAVACCCFRRSTDDIAHTGTGQQFVAGALQGPAAGLAICQYDDDSGFYLFGCDEQWKCITDTWHQTLDEAMQQAEFEYEGVTETWIKF